MGIRVASTMPANDASKAVCGANERSLEDSECSRKERQRNGEVEHMRTSTEDRSESERVTYKHEENGIQTNVP